MNAGCNTMYLFGKEVVVAYCVSNGCVSLDVLGQAGYYGVAGDLDFIGRLGVYAFGRSFAEIKGYKVFAALHPCPAAGGVGLKVFPAPVDVDDYLQPVEAFVFISRLSVVLFVGLPVKRFAVVLGRQLIFRSGGAYSKRRSEADDHKHCNEQT